ALASALAQTAPVEIIVSNNGSSDSTSDYLRALPKHSNLRVFEHSSTMRVQQHGWFIVSQVRTDWVVFLSDDDSLQPDFGRQIGLLIDERPEVALVYTGCNIYFGPIAAPSRVGSRFEDAADLMFEFMKDKRHLCMCGIAFRTAAYRAVGPQPDG